MTEKRSTHQAAEDQRNEEILIYLNGKTLPKAEASVSAYDSGFMLGDGVWKGNNTWALMEAPIERLFEAIKAIDLEIGFRRQAELFDLCRNWGPVLAAATPNYEAMKAQKI